MENSKFVKFILIFSLGFFVFNISGAFAYDIETHAYLTDEIINFYNQNFSNQEISNELKDYVIDGSRREDDPLRWMNHFYDPVYNRGLTIDTKMWGLKDIAAVSFVNITAIKFNWLASKIWAQDGNSQKKLTYSPTIATILSSLQSKKIQDYFPTSDFTWQEAIRYWNDGNQEMAMFALGHILHLIEDKAVPDHTRNDPHPGNSPYEIYTQQFTLNNSDDDLSDRLKNRQPVILNDINIYFDELAKYSNNNFYSLDTIGIQSGYQSPQPNDYERIDDILFALGRDETGFYKLSSQPVKYGVFINTKGTVIIDDDRILNDYWSRLSVKSIQYGAGVINLFFQEAEKAKNNPDFAKKTAEGEEKSFFAQISSAMNGAVSSVGGFFSDILGNRENSQQSAVENSANQVAAEPVSSLSNQNSSIPNQNNSQPNTINQNSISGNAPSLNIVNSTENLPVNQLANQQAILLALQLQLNEISDKANNLNQQVQLLALQSANVNNTPLVYYGGGGGGAPVILSVSGGGASVENQQSDNQQQITQDFQQNSTSTNQTTSLTEATTSIATSTIENSTSAEMVATSSYNIIISEILFDAQDSDKGKEFIELYNPTNNEIDLNGWSLRYFRENSTSVKSLAVFGVKSEDITLIPTQGFLLVGLNDYDSVNYGNVSADILRNESLPNGSETTIVVLYDGQDNEIDKIIYSKDLIIEEGQSLERLAWQNNECVSSQGNGEFLGNGCDSGEANNFEIRGTPNPQNSSNLPEPRSAPTAPQNFNVQYSSSTKELILNWLESQDYSGSTSTLIYRIKEITDSSSSLQMIETTSTNAAIAISELGRNYEFDILAFDRDGLKSATSSANIYIDAPQISNATSTDSSATSAKILLSQLDESSSTIGYAWLYQEFGSGISGKLQSLEFKMYTGDACQYFSLQEFNDVGYSQLSREFDSMMPNDNSEPDFVVRLADGSLWNYGTCDGRGGGKITLEFNDDIEAVPDKYYRLYFKTGDASRYASFIGSDFDAGFGNFRGCNQNTFAGGLGPVRWIECSTLNFDIYFILKGLKTDDSDKDDEDDLLTS